MNVIVSGRHLQVSDALRQHAEDKVGAVIAEYPKLTSARVVLEIQKAQQFAEVIIHGKNLEIEATHRAFDMYEAIDQAAAKADKQLRRFFDRVHDHRKTLKNIPPVTRESLAAEEEN